MRAFAYTINISSNTCDMNFKKCTSMELYRLCINYLFTQDENVSDQQDYRLALVELKGRGELELIYSIALNASY